MPTVNRIVYSAISNLFGFTTRGGQRHEAFVGPFSPGSGDYAQTDSDVIAGVANAYAKAVVILDPSTGYPTRPGAPVATAPYTGQQTVTTGAVALPAQTLVNGLVLKSLSSNSQTVYVGPSGVTNTTGYPLAPGEAISFSVTNATSLYVLGQNTSDVVAFAGN